MKQDLFLLERGDVYFFYRPRVQTDKVHSLEDIQRLYLILKGEQNPYYRLIVVGKKRFPSYEESQIEFAFVDAVSKSAGEIISFFEEKHYETKTRGERTLPPARLFADGKYILLRQGANAYLTYQLDQPKKLGQLQLQLDLKKEDSWIISVKNPAASSEKGLAPQQKADFPKELLDRFQNRKFIPLNSPDYLNYPGAELLLIAEKVSPEEKWKDSMKELFASFPVKPLSGA